MSTSKNVRNVIIMIIIVIIIVGALLFGIYKMFLDPYREAVTNLEESLSLDDTISKEEAIEDLDYMMDKFKKYHPAWSDDSDDLVTRVSSQYQTEIENMSDTMTMLEEWQAASRIVATMKDAHTRVSTSRLNGEYSYPFSEDGINISDITAINNEPIDDIYNRFIALWPYELEQYAKARFERFIPYDEYLRLAGVDTTNGIDITYNQSSIIYTKHYDATIEETTTSSNFYYDIDAANNIAILTLTTCKETDEFYTVLDEFFTKVNQNQITNVAVDLRENNGGWMYSVREFLKYIDVDTYQYCNNLSLRIGPFWKTEKEILTNNKKSTLFNDQLYVLTSGKTFSAAMDFAMIVKDNNLGQIIGSTPGNLPDSYTNNIKFQLPNSKLKLVVSTMKQNRIDETKQGQELTPDYEVPASDALNKLYELIKNN